jgi:hypothetical protein
MWKQGASILAVGPYAAGGRPNPHSSATVAGFALDLIDACQSARQRRIKKAPAMIREVKYRHTEYRLIGVRQAWLSSDRPSAHPAANLEAFVRWHL